MTETTEEIVIAIGTETEVIEDVQDPRTIDLRDAAITKTHTPPVETIVPENEKTDTGPDVMTAIGIETGARDAGMMTDDETEIFLTTGAGVEVEVDEIVIVVDAKIVMNLLRKREAGKAVLLQRRENPRQT